MGRKLTSDHQLFSLGTYVTATRLSSPFSPPRFSFFMSVCVSTCVALLVALFVSFLVSLPSFANASPAPKTEQKTVQKTVQTTEDTTAIKSLNPSQSTPLRIATASNFLPVLKKLLPLFEQESQIKTQAIAAASAVLFQQIHHGAPFDVFLSADTEKPIALEKQNLIVENSRVTYAMGRLALYAETPKHFTLNDTHDLNFALTKISQSKQKLAIANPKFAPYGVAAKQALNHLNLWAPYQGKLILGANVSQTFQQVRAQVINYGLVAYSQLRLNNLHGWLAPLHFHQPIIQQAVILESSANQAHAQKFINFLLSSKAQTIIRDSGYDLASMAAKNTSAQESQ